MNQREFDELTKEWKNQHLKDACWPACMGNVMNQMDTDFPRKRLKLSNKDLKDVCGYQAGLGSRWGGFVEELNVILRNRKSQFHAYERWGTDYDFEFIRGVAASPSKSYPMICVAPDYFAEQGVSIQNNPMDHVLVVVSVDEANVWFHDPYRPFAERSNRDAIFKCNLPLSKMLGYWNSARMPRWTLWIEKVEGPLDRYGLEA